MRVIRFSLIRFSLGLVAIMVITSLAPASVVTDFGIFGDRMVMVGGSLGGASNQVGPIGSNGDVKTGNNGVTVAMSGGGMLMVGGSPDVFGELVFNGDATFGNNAIVMGNIDSGGNVKFGGSADVTGNIRAAGNIQFGNNSDVTGNVDAGGNGNFGSNMGISGNLTLGGTIASGSPSVGGSTTQNGSPAAPAVFSAVSIPGASSFSAGGTSHSVGNNSSITLAPGSFGAIALGSGSDLILTLPGTYYLSSLVWGSSGKLFLDLDAGVYKIFVDTLVDIGSSLKFWDLSANTVLDPFASGAATADAALAANLFLEVGTDFSAGSNSEWIGTVFAPDGDILFAGSADVAGALYAGNENGDGDGGTVKFTNNALFDYQEFSMLPSQFFPDSGTGDGSGGEVPELSSFIVWTLLIGLCTGIAQWRRSAVVA